jgi:hypothetical protein
MLALACELQFADFDSKVRIGLKLSHGSVNSARHLTSIHLQITRQATY